MKKIKIKVEKGKREGERWVLDSSCSSSYNVYCLLVILYCIVNVFFFCDCGWGLCHKTLNLNDWTEFEKHDLKPEMSRFEIKFICYAVVFNLLKNTNSKMQNWSSVCKIQLQLYNSKSIQCDTIILSSMSARKSIKHRFKGWW